MSRLLVLGAGFLGSAVARVGARRLPTTVVDPPFDPTLQRRDRAPGALQLGVGRLMFGGGVEPGLERNAVALARIVRLDADDPAAGFALGSCQGLPVRHVCRSLSVGFGEGERHLGQGGLDVALEGAARDAEALCGLGLGQALNDVEQERLAQVGLKGGQGCFGG